MHSIISPAILYWGTPIVFITTKNEDGSPNIGAMSSAFWLAHRCMLGLDSSSQTTANLLRTGQCVLNLPSEDLAENLNKIARTTGSNPVPPWKAAGGYTYCKDKFAVAGLTEMGSDFVEAPRIKECPVQMEAELVEVGELMKDLPDRKGLLYKMELRILRTHVEDELRLPGHANRIDSGKLRPMFMAFQKYYGIGKEMPDGEKKSDLAEIGEEHYRVFTRSVEVEQKGDKDHLVSDGNEGKGEQ